MKATAWLLAAAIAATLACASDDPTPASAPIETFTPAYYDVHVVHYDPYGLPYYIEDGEAVYIERRDPEYDRLITFYMLNREAYRRWEDRAP